MKYFDKLSKITYDNGQYAVLDIFDRVRLDYISPDAIAFIDLDKYSDPRLYMISKQLYSTVEYWWILAILNEKWDIIYDMPLPLELMQAVAAQETTAQEISDKFDELLVENADNKYLKVIKPNYMNKVILEIIRQLEG